MSMVCGHPQGWREDRAHVDRGQQTLIFLWTS